MLTGMHVAIIGGDARQLEVIRKLVELDAKLSLVGFDQLAHHFTGATKMSIEEVDFADLDAIILPVHGTTLDGKVNSVFSHEPIPFTEEMVQIEALLIPTGKWFGFRKDGQEIRVPWKYIRKIGADMVMIDAPEQE